MATLADFKRKLVVGTKLHTIKHTETIRDEKGLIVWENGKTLNSDKDLGVAEVSIVQTNSFAIKRKNKSGELKDSWLEYPKAKDIIFDGTTAQIFFNCPVQGRLKAFTYTFVD